MRKLAIIFGICGQDGSYLSELLLSKNYEVWGMVRRSSSVNTARIEHVSNQLNLRYGDVTDSTSLVGIFMEIKNKYFTNVNSQPILEVYNLAAQSHVKISFDVPLHTAEVTANGALYLLEAIRMCDLMSQTRFYQASSSELYGLVQTIPQNEKTPFYPRSPYAISKLFAHWMTINYREAYNLHASCGILFNHESPRRAVNFVTRKITLGIAKILNGVEKHLILGNLDAKRDWGHAKDFVRAMWLMLQQEKPGDYVISTDRQHSVREFVEMCFAKKNIKIIWEGEGLNEIGKDSKNGQILVKVDAKFYRPSEVQTLLGDSSFARKCLNWQSEITFDELVSEMLESDCANII